MTQVQVRNESARAVEPEVTAESISPTITGGWWLAHENQAVVSEFTRWGWFGLLAVGVLAVNGACCLIMH